MASRNVGCFLRLESSPIFDEASELEKSPWEMKKREFTIKVKSLSKLGLCIPWEVSLKSEKKYQTKKLKYC